MKVAIMQPYFLPYPGYFQLISEVDLFVIYDDVNFIKRGWINRNYLLQNEVATRFTLEVIGGSQNRLIKDLSVGGNKEKLKRMMTFAYGKAPMYQKVKPLIDAIFDCPEENLSLFIGNSLAVICDYLNISFANKLSSNIVLEEDLKGQERLIAICKELGANEYVNAIGGKSLYDRNDFDENDIKLTFLSSDIAGYPQSSKDFVPNLSIIDLLMFNNVETVCDLLKGYSLE